MSEQVSCVKYKVVYTYNGNSYVWDKVAVATYQCHLSRPLSGIYTLGVPDSPSRSISNAGGGAYVYFAKPEYSGYPSSSAVEIRNVLNVENQSYGVNYGNGYTVDSSASELPQGVEGIRYTRIVSSEDSDMGTVSNINIAYSRVF